MASQKGTGNHGAGDTPHEEFYDEMMKGMKTGQIKKRNR
jgi:hypothetical protein